MATSKTQTVNYQNQNNALAPTSVSFTGEPIVMDGQIRISYNVFNPGVFTSGTATEGSSSNPTNDSNP